MDLQQRHEELRVWEKGLYPRKNLHPPEVAIPRTTVYPPSSFPLLWLLAPSSDFRVNRVIYFFVNAGALTWIIRVVWQIGLEVGRTPGSPWGKTPAWLFAAGTLGLFSNSTTWLLAQLGLLVNALVLAAVLVGTSARGSPVLSGLLWGLALIKPSSAFYLGFFYLAPRRWTGLLSAAVFVTVLTVAGMMIGNVTPTELWHSHARLNALQFVSLGTTVPAVLIAPGAHSGYAVLLSVVTGGLLGAFVFWRYRAVMDGLLVLAVTGTLNRVFFYHLQYDNLLLLFLLLAWGRSYFRNGSKWSPATKTVGALLALSLFIPMRAMADHLLLNALPVFWILAMIWLLRIEFTSARERTP